MTINPAFRGRYFAECRSLLQDQARGMLATDAREVSIRGGRRLKRQQAVPDVEIA